MRLKNRKHEYLYYLQTEEGIKEYKKTEIFEGWKNQTETIESVELILVLVTVR